MTQNTKPKPARTQQQRRAETRNLLMDTARELFLSKGYDQTSLPELVKTAGLTRGALYHHFADKADLFRALAEREAAVVTAVIANATQDIASPEDAMRAGTNAYFDAMAVPGRTTLLLALAPAILGTEEALALTAANDGAQLMHGLSAALPDLSETTLVALTNVLSSGFDRAAQEIAHGSDRRAYFEAMMLIINRLTNARIDEAVPR